MTERGSTTPLLKPYTVKTLPNGQRIGFIGLVTKDTPSAINAAMIRNVEFHDELPTIERYSRELTRQGVRAQVVLVHEGEAVSGEASANCDDETDPSSFSRRTNAAPTAVAAVAAARPPMRSARRDTPPVPLSDVGGGSDGPRGSTRPYSNPPRTNGEFTYGIEP
ncbi:hypothetical protein OG978_05885 [Streptomyces sp. NBC_01591]|uniref:hypothetical protein n=1 Tax=Streptomyces sp. NBC_01591 TaxID=2975888 RepID=UPI002DD8A9D7|nr:hypothetical protein [Streptomyces sp. NBC_01591]WSD66952.1 hypothetical protein OG978_05885 [Streptomyces sp. NBC_01591]